MDYWQEETEEELAAKVQLLQDHCEQYGHEQRQVVDPAGHRIMFCVVCGQNLGSLTVKSRVNIEGVFFAWSKYLYYPAGGDADSLGVYSTLDEARAACKASTQTETLPPDYVWISTVKGGQFVDIERHMVDAAGNIVD